MKKFLSIATVATVLASMTTACHDDDDDESGNYVSDFSSVYSLSALPGQQYTGGTTGVYQYAMSDKNGYTDAYIYMVGAYEGLEDTTTSGTDLATTTVKISELSDKFYGGFCPVNIEDGWGGWCLPACDTLRDGSTSTSHRVLLCNPGLLCRPLFSRHVAVDVNAVLGLLSVGKQVQGLWVAPTAEMAYADTARFNAAKSKYDLSGLNIDPLPAGYKIQFIAYGYVSSFNFTNVKEFLSTLKNAAAGMAKGGIASEPIDLVVSDSKGNVTVNGWQYLDLSGIKAYLWEASLRVVDANNKTVSDYELSDDNFTNYCLVDDITYEGGALSFF